MSNKITIKRSSVTGKVPEPGDLEYGEFALNYTDGNLFFKSNANVITNLASTQFVSVTGNVTGGNIVTAGVVTATGNITGNYFIGNGAFLTGINSSGSGVLTSTVDDFVGDGSTTEFTLSVTPGNENLTSVNISGVSQLRTAYSVAGNVLTFSSAPADTAEIEVTILSGSIVTLANLSNGTTVIDIPAANGNATVSVGGTANVMVITTTGANITGTLNVTGNTAIDNLEISGNVAGNLLPSANVTYDIGSTSRRWNDLWLAGTTIHLGEAEISANSTSVTITNPQGGQTVLTGSSPEISANTVVVTGNITGDYFIGNGSQLTGLPESGLSWTTQANAAPSSPTPGDFWYDAYTGVKYQYINDGTSNIWVDQSYPTSFSTLAVTGNATIGGHLGVVGNVTGSYFIGNGSQLTGLPASYSDANVAAYLPTYTGNLAGGNVIVSGTASVGSITKTGSNGVGNIGSNTSTFDTVFAKATSAQYADLAEIYRADAEYKPGTVLVFGGEHEVTVSNISHDIRAAGVVSTEPAHVMNSQAQGVAVALTGRVPCQVRGPVGKGDQLVNIAPGIAGAIDFAQYRPGCVIGKSLESIADSEVHVIEIAVGRY
jgi:hypothetical protein